MCDVSGDRSACLHSAGGCQKRLREDIGSDDRDFIKRMKGDFEHRLSCFRESRSALDDPNPLSPTSEALQWTSESVDKLFVVCLLLLFLGLRDTANCRFSYSDAASVCEASECGF